MKKNMGNADRIIRTILAILFFALYFGNVVTGTWGIVLLVVGIIFILTSLVSFCPCYAIFGMKTCKTEQHNTGSPA